MKFPELKENFYTIFINKISSEPVRNADLSTTHVNIYPRFRFSKAFWQPISAHSDAQ